MQITCRPPPSSRNLSPTSRAVLPPTPASISSKQRVESLPAAPRPLSASITRESSPPEAASRSGAASIPGLGATRSSIVSRPLAPKPSAWGLEHHLERCPGHRELLQLRGDALFEWAGGLGAPGAQP